jgi:hypothetical protein
VLLKVTEKPSVLEKKWVYKGLKCAVIFVRQSHRCGYVGLKKDHPYYGKDYDEIDVDVHGGLTFGDFGDDKFLDKDLYWLGFDCAHLGDKTLGSSFADDNERFWTLEEVVKETEKLADQLAKIK